MAKQTIIEIKEKIKRNRCVRLFFSPIMRIKYKKKYNEYLRSADSRYFKELKDTKKGKRCFIVCNGPSLVPKDLELIKDEYSFGFNRIYYIFDATSWRPSVYVSIDKDAIQMNSEHIAKMDVPLKFLDVYAKKCVDREANMHYLYCRDGFIVRPFTDKDIHFSSDLSKGYCDGGTVTYVAIQLAVYMGFEEIYILGADHNYSRIRKANGRVYTNNKVDNYFAGLKSTGITSIDIDRSTKAYTIARRECEQRKIKIYNATRGGKLEVFERIRLEDVVDNV